MSKTDTPFGKIYPKLQLDQGFFVLCNASSSHTRPHSGVVFASPPFMEAEQIIEKYAIPLKDQKDLAPVIEKLSSTRIVMLGESSHGTQEFYEWRRLISQELIEKHGFNFIAVEGDWPPCAELNRYIHSDAEAQSARDALRNFKRWPTWMWANTEVIKLADWLKAHNEKKSNEKKAGFFGLDVYSLFESIDEVTKQLQKIDPVLAKRVQNYYDCFEPYQRDEKDYAKSLFAYPEGCEDQVLQALRDLLKKRLDGMAEEKALLFDVQQNARVVKNAEHYYHSMIFGDEDSWNVRDGHMMETLNLLLKKYGQESKAIVWAHNTHVGDYRATNMVDAGHINIGGLAREQWGEDRVSLLGFGTFEGQVIASRAWDGPIETMPVPPGRPQSYEAMFHDVAQNLAEDSFFLWLKEDLVKRKLSQTLGHRAIGVVYNPAYERLGNYVPTSLSNRYDGFIFIDRTKALSPLAQRFARDEFPETWPQGF
jgi:erythromycin esterase